MELDDVKHAEDTLMGCAILDPSTMDLVGDGLQVGDWVTDGYAQAWAALRDFRDSGGPVADVASVVSLFRSQGILDRLGGVQTVARWSKAIPGSELFHAGILRRYGQSRRLAEIAKTISEQVENGEDPGNIALWADCQLDAISRDQTTDLLTMHEAATAAVDRMKRAAELERSIAISTGLQSLDASIGGFFPGEMVVVAARPSVGKTAFATQIAMQAGSAGESVLMLSLEMKAHELAVRQLSRITGLAVAELRAATLLPDDWNKVGDAVESLRDVDVSLLYSRNATTAKVRAASRLKRAAGGVSLVVVDYIGLMKSNDPRKPRWEQISEISAALKDLAMELEVPVVVLSQLNRMADKERPMLSHLRDSGSIEQDADVVLLLHRETKGSREATIDVAKNRQGVTGPVELRFDPSSTTFSDMGAKDMANYEHEFDDYSGSPF